MASLVPTNPHGQQCAHPAEQERRYEQSFLRNTPAMRYRAVFIERVQAKDAYVPNE
jgi:hypothetical protein